VPRRSSQSQHSAPVVVVLMLLVVVVLWSYVGVVCERVGFLWQRQAGCSVDYYYLNFWTRTCPRSSLELSSGSRCRLGVDERNG
jgi:hypothetical protein